MVKTSTPIEEDDAYRRLFIYLFFSAVNLHENGIKLICEIDIQLLIFSINEFGNIYDFYATNSVLFTSERFFVVRVCVLISIQVNSNRVDLSRVEINHSECSAFVLFFFLLYYFKFTN